MDSRGLAVGEEALLLSVTRLDAEVVWLFLEAGMTPNIRDQWASKYTPLRHAVSSCAFQQDMATIDDIVGALLAHGADVEDPDEYGMTTLIVAARYCPAEILQTLLVSGADVAAVSRSGTNAILEAIENDRSDNVALLIESGFDVASDGERLLKEAAGKAEIEAMLREARER